jgi:hypothetical protein
MIVFFSGGSAIVETSVRNPPPAIMLTYFQSHAYKSGKPEARLAKLIALRAKSKKKGTPKCKSKSGGKNSSPNSSKSNRG